MIAPLELNIAGRKRLPIIVAAEGGECGLACMAMVAIYHGHDVDLNGLRQQFSLSITGTTLRSLMDLASQLSLAPRALRVDLDSLHQLRAPAILHWDLDHFVVLKSVSKNRAIIHDPSRGMLQLSFRELSTHFTGIALELEPSATFTPVVARRPIRLTSLWSKIDGLWAATAQILALSLALQVVALAAPLQMQLVVDQAIGRNDRELLGVLAIGFGLLVVLQVAIEALRAWSLQVFGSLLTFQMVGNVVRHLLRLPSPFFEKRHLGDILSRINSTSSIQDALTRGIAAAFIDGAMALITAVILFVYSPVLAAIVLAAALLNGCIAFALYPSTRSRTEEQLVASSRERSHLMETVRATTTIKIMGGEAQREGQWRNLFAQVVNSSISVARLQIIGRMFSTLITGLSIVLILYISGRTIFAGYGFSVGMLMAFLSFRQTFSDSMSSLTMQTVQFRLLGLHLDRLSDVVTSEPEMHSGVAAAANVSGEIALCGVAFRYGASDPLVLANVEIQVQPGEFVAIIGASGCGKTTLLKLLLGLHSPTEGHVVLDGCRATPDLWRAWRARVGLVAQDDSLMSGSIAENIAFFDPNLSMPLVIGAAKAAQIHDEILRMPMQYLSLVGDMGSSLSGGQRQRILLARALYRNPAILMLDEGTANLDSETEAAISDLVASLPATRIVIAHRPALIERADRVMELRAGQLREVSIQKVQSLT